MALTYTEWLRTRLGRSNGTYAEYEQYLQQLADRISQELTPIRNTSTRIAEQWLPEGQTLTAEDSAEDNFVMVGIFGPRGQTHASVLLAPGDLVAWARKVIATWDTAS